jgi:hypothetical protein
VASGVVIQRQIAAQDSAGVLLGLAVGYGYLLKAKSTSKAGSAKPKAAKEAVKSQADTKRKYKHRHSAQPSQTFERPFWPLSTITNIRKMPLLNSVTETCSPGVSSSLMNSSAASSLPFAVDRRRRVQKTIGIKRARAKLGVKALKGDFSGGWAHHSHRLPTRESERSKQ